MKFTFNKPVTVDIKWLELEVAVRYDEDDMPQDFPGRQGDTWTARIEVDTGRITPGRCAFWPDAIDIDLCMKVTDCGTYRLYDDKGNVVAQQRHRSSHAAEANTWRRDNQ